MQDTSGGEEPLVPPQDTGSAVPPYEGRETSGEVAEESSEAKTIGGGKGPVVEPSQKADEPEGATGDAATSPADEQPAAEQPEADRDDDAVGPAHVPGTPRGEDRG
jgi:hypothetical protein